MPPLLPALAAALLLTLAACAGAASTQPTPSPQSTLAPTATPSPALSPTSQTSSDSGQREEERFDPDHALAHVQALAVEIGSRPAGSEAEASAADYIGDQLAGYGYEVTLQEFSFDVFSDLGTALETASPGPRDSQNVVARPPVGECRVIVGGHYDSVAAGPGANDNASGTATVMEVARVEAADGVFDDVCFVLFGAEEVGLIGSAEFVASLSAEERLGIEGMLNFDMVGVGTSWLLAGSRELRDLTAAEADRLGLVYAVSAGAPAGLGSDHSSFIRRGIPAIFFHRLGDPHYHTSEDHAEFVQGNRLAEIGEVGLAVIDALLTER